MTYMTKSAAAERIHNLACAASVILRTKQAGCCGRKPAKKKTKKKCASMSKEASRDFMRKLACAVAVAQRARGIQKYAEETKDTEKTPLWKNPMAIGGAGGAVLGGTLGSALGPKGKRFLSGLIGAGVGTGVGVGAGYGYTKLKKKDDEKKDDTNTVQQPDTTTGNPQTASYVSNLVNDPQAAASAVGTVVSNVASKAKEKAEEFGDFVTAPVSWLWSDDDEQDGDE